VLFGLFVAATMVLVRRRHLKNVRSGTLPVIPSDAHPHVRVPSGIAHP